MQEELATFSIENRPNFSLTESDFEKEKIVHSLDKGGKGFVGECKKPNSYSSEQKKALIEFFNRKKSK